MQTETHAEEILRIFKHQKEYSKTFRKSGANRRREILKLLLKRILENSPKIEDAVYSDFKRPHAETKLVEIFPVTSEIKYIIRNLTNWMQPHHVSAPLSLFGSKNKIIYEPKGTVLIIAPWNYPFQLALGPLVSAVAAGNTVILKPSEISTNTSAFLKEFISSIFDEKEAAVIEGGVETTKEILNLKFDHIFFTGSPKVGSIVMEAAAKNLTPVTLELGGKSPAVIDRNVDMKKAGERIAWGKFVNAGQTCIAPDYLICHEEIRQSFISEIIYAFRRMYNVHKGEDDYADMARIVNSNHYKRIMNLCEESEKMGAEKYTGTANPDDNFIAPTIYSNMSLDMPLMKEEIFGPVLPVLTYRSENDINEIIEANPNPLALYVFSKSSSFANRVIDDNPAGTVMVNDTVVHFSNHKLPFGGRNTSGHGKAHGYFGFREFSNEKPYMKQPGFSALKLLYPPYKNRTKRLIDMIVKWF